MESFKVFVEKVPNSGRIMAIDWGSKRTGYAISDVAQEFAADKGVMLDNPVVALPKILNGITPAVVGIVIGLPLLADGSDSDTSRMVRLFAESLAGEINLPIVFLDESLTSAEAEDRIKNSNAKKGRKMRMSIDAMAATILLEDALNTMSRAKRGA